MCNKEKSHFPLLRMPTTRREKEIIKYVCTISFFLNTMCKYSHKLKSFEMKTAGLEYAIAIYSFWCISGCMLAAKRTTWIWSSANKSIMELCVRASKNLHSPQKFGIVVVDHTVHVRCEVTYLERECVLKEQNDFYK